MSTTTTTTSDTSAIDDKKNNNVSGININSQTIKQYIQAIIPSSIIWNIKCSSRVISK